MKTGNQQSGNYQQQYIKDKIYIRHSAFNDHIKERILSNKAVCDC